MAFSNHRKQGEKCGRVEAGGVAGTKSFVFKSAASRLKVGRMGMGWVPVVVSSVSGPGRYGGKKK